VGDGQTEGSVVTAPSGGERRGRRGQAAGELWPRCGSPLGEREAGTGQQWAQAASGLWTGEACEEGAGRRHRQLPAGPGRWGALAGQLTERRAQRRTLASGGTMGSGTSGQLHREKARLNRADVSG
jgi:hypothetical protein